MNASKILVDLAPIVLIYLVHTAVNVQTNICQEDHLKLDVKELLLTWLVHAMMTVPQMQTVLQAHVDVVVDIKPKELTAQVCECCITCCCC